MGAGKGGELVSAQRSDLPSEPPPASPVPCCSASHRLGFPELGSPRLVGGQDEELGGRAPPHQQLIVAGPRVCECVCLGVLLVQFTSAAAAAADPFQTRGSFAGTMTKQNWPLCVFPLSHIPAQQYPHSEPPSRVQVSGCYS